jgi:hypothetical protein
MALGNFVAYNSFSKRYSMIVFAAVFCRYTQRRRWCRGIEQLRVAEATGSSITFVEAGSGPTVSSIGQKLWERISRSSIVDDSSLLSIMKQWRSRWQGGEGTRMKESGACRV